MGELLRMCVLECTAATRSAAELEDPWEAFTEMIMRPCENGAADAASRRTWQAAGDDALPYAAAEKAELIDAAAHVIDRAHAAGALRADFTVDDMPGLMCGLSAAIDAMPEPERWRRLVEFALDGLKAR